ncbi:hypothetical protein [Embleya sp. NPDC001921]
MGDSYAAGGNLVLRMDASGETESALLRRAVAALGRFGDDDLRPYGARSTRFLGGEGEAVSVLLRHPAHPAANSWIRVSLGDSTKGVGEIFMTVHLDEPGDELGPEWEMAVTLISRLVEGVSPILAHVTAWYLDGEGQIYPSGRLLPDSHLPEEFGPWTYVSGERLTDQLRDRIASLPAYASESLANGWLVRAVNHPREEPTMPFRDALNALDREGIAYRSPRLAAA